MAGSRYSSRMTVFQNAAGTAPAAGGSLTFCTTGTSDLEAIYLDDGLAVEAANPLPLDADGRMSSEAFLDDTVVYRVILKDSLGNTIADDDPVAGSDVTSGIAAHNADVNAHVTATTTNRGVVSELANDAEAIAKADTSRVLTPSNLAALDASTTFKGFIETATNAEALAQTDTARALTASNLAAYTGMVVNFASAQSSSTLTTTDVIPLDNTIPQNTEGTEYLTCSITPRFATSLLRVTARIPVIEREAGVQMIFALFRDSTADAIAASSIETQNPDEPTGSGIEAIIPATAATATTIKLRVGGSTSGGVRIGTANGSEIFSTAKKATMVVEEIRQ